MKFKIGMMIDTMEVIDIQGENITLKDNKGNIDTFNKHLIEVMYKTFNKKTRATRTTRTETLYKNCKPLIEACKRNDGYIKLEVSEDCIMPLVIENLYNNVFSITHYYKQNGDTMKDPDMTFEVVGEELKVLTYQQDNLGIYQEVYVKKDGKEMFYPSLKKDLEIFLGQWLKNIKQQGFMKLITQV